VDKHFLFGSMAETRETVYNIRKAGMANFGILLDMGHIPIMHETLQSAAMTAGELLEHIHLGNCVIKDKTSPYYGDKHPCWGHPGGEYDETDGAIFLEELKSAGYFTRGCARTVSFEMRPLTGKTAEQTVEYLSHWIKRTYAGI
jgi:sugar phosphate isomerase/epimerase